LRPLVARTIHRCTCQAVTTNHRGGTRTLPPAMPDSLAEDGLTIASASERDRRIRRPCLVGVPRTP
jgi:hypothetical protein